MSSEKPQGSIELPIHPGQFVKDHTLKPRSISVTEAAKIVGISRPAMSNFLNGKVTATPEMATRIERAFEIPSQRLLDMQATFDAVQAKGKGAPASAKAYVPPFLAITANSIVTWASENISARIRLAVFLRTLVHSTGIGLTKVDFPGNDDAESPGWDGIVEAEEGTPWIPKGISGWEFGTNEAVKGKADGDFAKSVKATSKDERKRTTFVFVTPRRWQAKEKWVISAKAKNLWKDVRAYDAKDIEQWLEQSLAGQAWFANETNNPAQEVRSLDKCWHDWADVASPSLPAALFSSTVDSSKHIMLTRLLKSPDKPIIVAADSVEEGLAFLSQLFSEGVENELASFRDRVLVFDKQGVLPRLGQGAQNFVPVVHNRETERELAPFVKSMHCIAIYPRNATNVEPDIILKPLDHEPFRLALEEMKKGDDEISKLSIESGRSLTILRRRLSNVPAIKTPDWAKDHNKAVSLIPFLFVGAWNSKNDTDKEGLLLLAGEQSYSKLEKDCQYLVQLNDPPMWSIGAQRGVISKIDLLHAISGAITEEDLRRYFSMARMVLGEDDPALDIPETERWAAAIRGKVRDFSKVFRDGISETLVLLAVHGNHLFKTRLGIDTELEAAAVVHDLLHAPLTTRVLEANDQDLPTYAEAVPYDFLSLIEEDLETENPAVLGLLRPANSGTLGLRPSRTGLLWALEVLAWNPATLKRTTRILARLALVEISDNWVNKPTNSLESIFRSWMPQTAANHEVRVNVLKSLAVEFPTVAWGICMAQFSNHNDIGHHSYKPRWRPDGYGFGEPVSTWGPILQFRNETIEMALCWKEYNLGMLRDLVARIHNLDETYQARVWNLVKVWATEKASDTEKAALREAIRVTAMSRVAATRAKSNSDAAVTFTAAKQAYAALEPTDLLNKHAWLFREEWVRESYDEIHAEIEIDFNKRDERINSQRNQALREVFEQRGIQGIIELAKGGNAAWRIGALAASLLPFESSLVDLLRAAILLIFEQEGSHFKLQNLIRGALRCLDDEKREKILTGLVHGLSEDSAVKLFLLAPFCRRTWNIIDHLGEHAQNKYWMEIDTNWIGNPEDENNEAVVRLLSAQRPRAAFSMVQYRLQKLDARMLFQILTDMLKDGHDKPGHDELEEHYIQKAFAHITLSAELTIEQKAGLEFGYIDALAHRWGLRNNQGIPNLERYIESHPEVFVQAIVCAYKRDDNEIDPPELQVPTENKKQMAQRSYRLLEGLKRIPGHNDLDILETYQLTKWIKAVRDSCAQLARGEIGDICIGKLLSAAPVGSDGVWPCEPVRQVLEDLRSKAVMRGVRTGRYNARGVSYRSEGGNPERGLAQEYRKWADAVQFTHTYVASELLIDMARMYETEASREDTASDLRRRLG